MKIIKSKLKGDKFGFFIEQEKGEKPINLSVFDYKTLKGILKKHTTTITNFTIISGNVVLTTVGEPEFCIRANWRFPKGTYDVHIQNDHKLDSIFIPFKIFRSDTVLCHLFLTAIHLPGEDKIHGSLLETACLPALDKQLYLMDEEKWSKYKSLVYSKKYKTDKEVIDEMDKTIEGISPIIQFKLNENSESREDKGTKCFYFAYSGLTLDGDPAYLWLRKVKRYDKK